MPAPATEVVNAVLTRKDRHTPRSTMASGKPFVVSNPSTKRYAPSKKIPAQGLLSIPLRTLTKQRPSVPYGAPTRGAPRTGALPCVIPKAESRCSSPKPMPMLVRNMTTKVVKSLLLPPVSSRERPFPEKMSVLKPLKIVESSKERKYIGGKPTSASGTRRLMEGNVADERLPRPSCIPHSRIHQSSRDALEAFRGKKDDIVKVSTTRLRNSEIAGRKASVDIGMDKAVGSVKVTDTFVKKSVVASDCRTGMPTRNRMVTSSKPIICPQAVTPSSPDLSSFPSQSWTIVVDLDLKQAETLTTVCSDQNPSSMGEAPRSAVMRMPDESCGPSDSDSESVSSSPTVSSSSTVIETLAKPMVGSDDMVKVSSLAESPFVEFSPMICAPTTISIATLAQVADADQALSLTGTPESDIRTQMAVACATETSQKNFLLPRHSSLSDTGTISPKPLGTRVSQIRKLFMPSVDRDAKASKNPMTQLEIEMLRMRKKVAGGGLVDPCLDRLGSLSAMAIVTKLRMSIFSSDRFGQA